MVNMIFSPQPPRSPPTPLPLPLLLLLL